MNAAAQSLIAPDQRRGSHFGHAAGMTLDRPADFQQLAAAFAAAVDEHQRSNNEAEFQHLQTLRAWIVEALLALRQVEPALVPSVNILAAACKKSGLRSYPRTHHDEELLRKCLAALDSAPDEDAAVWFAAMLMAWHAFELPRLPSLAAVPQEIRPAWLSFLLEDPSAFVRPGDAERFVHYLKQVCELVLWHLRSTIGPADDVAMAFFSSSAFVQVYFNELNLRDLMMTRAAIIENILTRRGAVLDQLRLVRPSRARPRIGFIVLSAAGGTETTALAANLERLDRRRLEVRLYSLAEPSGTMGALCRAAAETYQQLPGKISEAVARLRSEDLDIAIFCTNLAVVAHQLTLIAAHRVAPVQTVTTASGVTTGLHNVDILISSVPNETQNSPAHYTEHLIYASGALGCYPFQYMFDGCPPPDPVSRSMHGVPDDVVLFFSAANFYKILPELSAQWLRILKQVPNSHLMLMPFNPNWSSQYPFVAFHARLRAQADEIGVALDRVHLHGPVPTIQHLHRIMEMADIYLDAIPFSGACSLTDPLTVGLPIVSREGKVFRSRQSKAMLEAEGLGDWISPDDTHYMNRAIELATNSALRKRERERLERIRSVGLKVVDTAPYALMMMSVYDHIVADWNDRVASLHALASGEIAQKICGQAAQFAKRGAIFTDRDLILQVVLPYLRNGGTRRLIEVGAFLGATSKAFLQESWQAVLFEPDERCQQQLETLVEAYPGQVRIEKAAVTADRDGSVPFHLTAIPGLSGLSGSPFVEDAQRIEVPSVALTRYITAMGLFDLDFINIDAEGHDFTILQSLDFRALTPRLVMVGFDEETGQGRASVDATLRAMRGRGYRACVICLRTFLEFKRHEWPKSLLAIGVDAVPQSPTEFPLFGNVLFFREDDRDFLPSLSDWLEQPIDWERRGLIPAA